jgi:hypothetical protein
MKELYNLFLFIAICLVIYLVFTNFNYNPLREGMTDASGNSVSAPAPKNGIAGNASAYAASLKSAGIKFTDIFLVSKYRSDYESAILNLDDLINNLMLKASLSFDQNDPKKTISNLAEMQQAKVALNSVMKFIDSST